MAHATQEKKKPTPTADRNISSGPSTDPNLTEGGFEAQILQAKVKGDTAKADLTVAKAEEQQIKTALLGKQATEQGLEVGAPSPIAATAQAASFIGPQQGAQFGPPESPQQQQLRSLSAGMGISIDENAIRRLRDNLFPRNPLADSFRKMFEGQFSEIEEKNARLKELRSAPSPNFGDRVLQGLTLGIYDPTNDDEISKLEREKRAIVASLMGVAQTTVAGSQRARTAFATQAFQSILGNMQQQKLFGQQMQLFGIQRTAQLQTENRKKAHAFELQAKAHANNMEREELRARAAAAVAAGKAGPEQDDVLNYEQGMSGYLQNLNSSGNFSGNRGMVFNAIRSAVQQEIAGKRVDQAQIAATLVKRIGSPALAKRVVQEMSGEMASIFSRYKSLQRAEVPATDQTHHFKGMLQSHSTANLLLNAMDQEAESADTQTIGADGVLTTGMNVSGMISAYMQQRGMMAVPGDPVASGEVLATGMLEGKPFTDATIIRKAMEDGVWKSPEALTRVATARIGAQIQSRDSRRTAHAEKITMTAYIESQVNLRIRAGLDAAGIKPGREINRSVGLKAREGVDPGGPVGAFKFRKGFGINSILLSFTSDEILQAIQDGVGTKNQEEFSMLDRIFTQRDKLAPVLKKLGWTSIEKMRQLSGQAEITSPSNVSPGPGRR